VAGDAGGQPVGDVTADGSVGGGALGGGAGDGYPVLDPEK
jgi:hypothetical protein